jgi:membrane fusion protein
VTAQTPLASILPHGSFLQARLLVPTAAIGFVHAGEPVRLRYSAFPYEQFGLYHGTVRQVSRSIITSGELDLPVSPRSPYYLITASLAKPYVHAYGRRLPLTSGMTLSADIVLDREPLYEWVLRPIESLRGKL